MNCRSVDYALKNHVKNVEDVMHLFVFVARYVLETSAIRYLFSNPEEASTQQFKAADKDPTLASCASLPLTFDGIIDGKQGKSFGTSFPIKSVSMRAFANARGCAVLLCTPTRVCLLPWEYV
jgi:hypothetical protein